MSLKRWISAETEFFDIEGPFDSDQHIVGGAQLDGAAPGQASALCFDNTADLRHRQIDWGERFHCICRSGRRGDGP